MPEQINIAKYPPLKKKQVDGEPKEIKVDKPGQFGKQQQKGVKVLVMKITKQTQPRRRMDPRRREFF